MKGLIDADIVVFRSGFAAERNVWHLHIPEQDFIGIFEYKREAMDELDKRLPGIHSREELKDYKLFPEVQLEPLSHALNNAKTLIQRALDDCQLNEFDAKLYLSGGKNYRYDIAKTRPYKGNRDKVRRPTYEQEIKEYLIKNWDTTVADGEEADDLLGIAQTTYGPQESIIISLDKDLDQVPGYKYNWMHKVHYEVTEAMAHYNFHVQLLTGDSTDNIPGLPGIGKGKAQKALHGIDHPAEQIEEVQRMYQIHSGKEDWYEYLIEQGQLLWVRREPGQMWTTPKFFENEGSDGLAFNSGEETNEPSLF